MEASQPIARQFLRDPETMTLWKETGGKLARGLIEKLSQTGQSVPLFQEISKLVMTVVLYALMGPAFTEKHGETIIPMVQAYEVAIQSPEIKAFPWWATKAGRLTKSVEQHFERLVDEEIKCRLAHPEKHRNSSDFLRIMLEKRDIYNKGTLPILYTCNGRIWNPDAWAPQCRTREPDSHVLLVFASRHKIPIPFDAAEI